MGETVNPAHRLTRATGALNIIYPRCTNSSYSQTPVFRSIAGQPVHSFSGMARFLLIFCSLPQALLVAAVFAALVSSIAAHELPVPARCGNGDEAPPLLGLLGSSPSGGTGAL